MLVSVNDHLRCGADSYVRGGCAQRPIIHLPSRKEPHLVEKHAAARACLPRNRPSCASDFTFGACAEELVTPGPFHAVRCHR